ncbi:DNA mismatch repair protein MutT, partial [Pseudomonas putida]
MSLYRPFRGHARSHRYLTAFETCAIPVGAG